MADSTHEPTDTPDEAPAKRKSRSRVKAVTPVFSATEEVEPVVEPSAPRLAAASLLFQAPDLSAVPPRRRSAERSEPDEPEASEPETKASGDDDSSQKDQGGSSRRRRGSRGRRRSSNEDSQSSEEKSGEKDDDKDGGRATESTHEEQGEQQSEKSDEDAAEQEESSSSRRRRRRRSRSSRSEGSARAASQVSAVEGSTRLEAKRQRRREGREAGRRRHTITESEFLARRESVDRVMVVRERDGLNQIAVLEDDILVEHYVARRTQTSMVGNVYLGRVQNVLPSMEAAFVDLGKGRNAVLYAGEVNWDALGTEGQPRRIEHALKSGDTVLVQVTKDPIGHKGARLTSQITLAGRHLVLVPSGAMTGISRKLPDNERSRLKKLLKQIVPEGCGVIVRTAAEGATEEQLRDDVARLVRIWEDIEKKSKSAKSAPVLLKGEPELAVRVVRDVFNEDFSKLVVSGNDAYRTISEYVTELSPDLADRLEKWTDTKDVFSAYRVDEQLAKGMDRKVWLPSGGSLVIDRTEAMTVVDVNTGRFTGSGGSLEETVTKNNLEAAEEIVRQLRLRDIGGIIVIDFIDMVLESNRDLVLRRLIECLGRDRTRHQVAEVTSLGLVQMTRKRVGQGLVEAFSESCPTCSGRGFLVHSDPVEKNGGEHTHEQPSGGRRGGRRGGGNTQAPAQTPSTPEEQTKARAAIASIAKAAQHAHAEEPAEKEKPTSRDQSADTAEPAEKSAPLAEEKPAEQPAPRKRRRATAAAGSPQDSDPTDGIISLPAPQPTETAATLPTSMLDSIVFPEQEERQKPAKKSRRVVASGQNPSAAREGASGE